MSWAITCNDIDKLEEIPADKLDEVSRDNPAYRADAQIAFDTAQFLGLVMATLSGGRTPSPYGGPDSVVLSIVGFDSRKVGTAVPLPDFNDEMRRVVLAGPDTLRELAEIPDE